jgi:hypothetical protein
MANMTGQGKDGHNARANGVLLLGSGRRVVIGVTHNVLDASFTCHAEVDYRRTAPMA